jgi:hypothetical protein
MQRLAANRREYRPSPQVAVGVGVVNAPPRARDRPPMIQTAELLEAQGYNLRELEARALADPDWPPREAPDPDQPGVRYPGGTVIGAVAVVARSGVSLADRLEEWRAKQAAELLGLVGPPDVVDGEARELEPDAGEHEPDTQADEAGDELAAGLHVQLEFGASSG